MADLCVAHLVRASNGPEPVRKFLASYRRHPAGTEHELTLIVKGADAALRASLAAQLSGFPHRVLEVPDQGFDIGAYDAAIRALPHARFVLLNSFSEILRDGWLELLARQLAPGVGAVAATGSYESVLEFEVDPPRSPRALWWLRSAWRKAHRSARRWQRFGPFPNPHLRTNALLIRRETWLALALPPLREKLDANAFEAGRASLSTQLGALGLGLVVAGADGVGRAPADWPASRTFRSGAQENLLVSDNRTRQYSAADPSERRALALRTWGDATLADLETLDTKPVRSPLREELDR